MATVFKDGVGYDPPSKYPSSVQSAEDEALMGQRGMNIYLVGKNNNEQFYYRFFMEGTKEANYTVCGMWRGGRPLPAVEHEEALKLIVKLFD